MPAVQETLGNVCRQCNARRMFTRTHHQTNHLVHALVTLFLCGLWLPVWIYLSYTETYTPWRCNTCGATLYF